MLRDINLRCREGEFVAIVGYSGAGKTTLISLIAGLSRPTRARVTLRRQAVTGPGPERGVVFQNYSLLPWLTVYENVHLAVDQVLPRLDGGAGAASTSRSYLAMVNLRSARDKQAGASCRAACGSASRVARALAMDPEVLLMDEPLRRSTR